MEQTDQEMQKENTINQKESGLHLGSPTETEFGA
jgi:hypothetical protein